MPECHNCRWNDEPPTDEKAAACTACELPADRTNHKGRTFLSLEAGAERGGQTAAEVEAALQTARAEAEAGADALPLPDCCRQTALALLDYMDGLTGRELKLLVEVAHGATLADIADAGVIERKGGRGRRGRNADGTMTRASVSKIWRGILERFPDLAEVLITGTSNDARMRLQERMKKRKAARAWEKVSRANASAEP